MKNLQNIYKKKKEGKEQKFFYRWKSDNYSRSNIEK